MLPFFVSGTVSEGFRRGSGELGFPTANYSSDTVASLAHHLRSGIYCGWCQIGNSGAVHPAVISLGYNPYYRNRHRTMEVHIIHPFDKSFYGITMKTCLIEYLRAEKDFPNLKELASAIAEDIERARHILLKPHSLKYKHHNFFTEQQGIIS